MTYGNVQCRRKELMWNEEEVYMGIKLVRCRKV